MISLNEDQLGAAPDNGPVDLTFCQCDPAMLDQMQLTVYGLNPKKAEILVSPDGMVMSIRLIGVDRQAAKAMGFGSSGD